MYRSLLRGGAVLAVLLGTVAAAVPAQAAQSEETLQCGGAAVTVRVNDNNSSDNGGWGAAQVVSGGSGHFIPTSFGFAVYDDTIGQELFSFTQTKGNGNANHRQDSRTCTETFSGTLGDLLEPGETPPPGTSVTDLVTATFTVTVVQKP